MAHNAVRDIIGKFCLQSGIAVEREKPNMLLARSGADKRQITDLVLKENGTVTLLDVTIRNPVAPSRLARTRYGDLIAAKEGESQKSALYRHRIADTGFVPACFESFGAWGPAVQAFLNKLSHKWMEGSDDPGADLESTRNQLSHKISSTLIRGMSLIFHHKFRALGRPFRQDRREVERNNNQRREILRSNSRQRMVRHGQD